MCVTDACAPACGGLKLLCGIILDCHPLYSLRRSLYEPGAHGQADLASPFVVGNPPVSAFPRLECPLSIQVDSGHPNPGLHTCISSTGPSPSHHHPVELLQKEHEKAQTQASRSQFHRTVHRQLWRACSEPGVVLTGPSLVWHCETCLGPIFLRYLPEASLRDKEHRVAGSQTTTSLNCRPSFLAPTVPEFSVKMADTQYRLVGLSAWSVFPGDG